MKSGACTNHAIRPERRRRRRGVLGRAALRRRLVAAGALGELDVLGARHRVEIGPVAVAPFAMSPLDHLRAAVVERVEHALVVARAVEVDGDDAAGETRRPGDRCRQRAREDAEGSAQGGTAQGATIARAGIVVGVLVATDGKGVVVTGRVEDEAVDGVGGEAHAREHIERALGAHWVFEYGSGDACHGAPSRRALQATLPRYRRPAGSPISASRMWRRRHAYGAPPGAPGSRCATLARLLQR